MRASITIKTPRLILRQPTREDFEPYAELIADEKVARFIGGVQSRPAAWRSFMAHAGAWALEGFAMFSVLDRKTGQWLGRVGPWHPEGWPGNEIGWSLIRSAWGKGLAFEAANATIAWSIHELGWTDIVHSIDLANIASQKLAKRLGSVNTGPMKLPPPYEHVRNELWRLDIDRWKHQIAQEPS